VALDSRRQAPEPSASSQLPIGPPHADAYTATVDGTYLDRTLRRGPLGGDAPASRHLTVAAGRGADLVVFPELATTGYYWPSAEAIAPYAETVTAFSAGLGRQRGIQDLRPTRRPQRSHCPGADAAVTLQMR